MERGLIAPAAAECGVDEAGRGPLAGPVVAAAVVLPEGFAHPLLDDSKKTTEAARIELREAIEREAVAWCVAEVDAAQIDRTNILRAAFEAMNRAVAGVAEHLTPNIVLVDGNRFRSQHSFPFRCEVGGDARFASIAAASILAKAHRDELMRRLHAEYPVYGWDRNLGYPTEEHVRAIWAHGVSPYHRRTFAQCMPELDLFGKI